MFSIKKNTLAFFTFFDDVSVVTSLIGNSRVRISRKLEGMMLFMIYGVIYGVVYGAIYSVIYGVNVH